MKALLLVLALLAGAPAWAGELTLGLFAYRSKDVLQSQWQPLLDHLNAQLPASGQLRMRLLDQAEMGDALARGELDFVFTHPGHYIQLRARNTLSGALATQVTLDNGVPTSRLGGAVIRRADRPELQTLADLRDQRVATAARESVGGYTAQAMALRAAGVDPRKLALLEVARDHDHDRVVQAVASGAADAGFVRTGVLERFERDGRLAPGTLVVVAPRAHANFPYASSTDLYPEWPFVALPHVNEGVSRRLAALLLSLDPDHPAVRRAGLHGFTVPADYAPVEAAMRTLRLPPFDRAPAISWTDIWQQHRAELAFGSLALLAVLAHQRQRAARRETQHLSQRLVYIIDGTRAGTWEWNVQTGETRFNERWAEIAGYRLEELQPVTIGTWMRLAHPQDLQRSNEALERHFRGETDHYDCEVRIQHKDGHWVWVHDRGRVSEWTTDGQPLWMFGTHVDITERRRAETESAELLGRLQELAANVPGLLYQYRLRPDGSSHFTYASAGLRDLYGCEPADVAEDAAPVFAAIHPEDLARVGDGIQASAARLQPWHDHYRVRHPQRGERWLEGNATPTRHADGSVTWHGHIRDVTELQQGRDRLKLAARVFEASQEGIMITDAGRRIIDVNPAYTRITGYSRAESLGRDPSMLQSGLQGADFYQAMNSALAQEGRWQGEVWNRRKTGEVYAELLSIAAVPDDDGTVRHFVAIFSDISRIKAHQQELDRIAHYDPLTGVPNRRLLGDRLTQALAHARRSGQRVAVCMLDLDGFKPVNDTHGHEAGDRLLAEVAQRLSGVLRAEETVARLGGDEFVLILRNPASDAVFERVLAAVRSPVRLPQGPVKVSASLGVAWFEGGDADGDQLLREADQALYQSKARGRDRYTVFAPTETTTD